MIKYEALKESAKFIANKVFPVPGGPCNRIPAQAPFSIDSIKFFK